jgi:antitoxin ParD1/3/4
VNVHLGDLEAYVQKKLAQGGYSSASEVVREALREQRERERDEEAERRLQTYVLKGIDQGPPDGMSPEDWERRITAARERMRNFIRVGLDQLQQGQLVDGAQVAEKLRAKQAARRTRTQG